LAAAKKNDNGTKPLTSTNWTVSGTSYKGTFTGFTSNALLAVDNNVTTIPNIEIQFAGTPAAGTYAVVNNLTYGGTLSSSQCFIDESDSSADYIYYSDNGGTVTVTVNGGKVTATFNNVGMASQSGFDNNGNATFTSVGTTSGALIEQ